MGSAASGFAQLSPSQRSLASAIGSLTKWSRLTSPEARRAATEAARAARHRSWEAKADPEGRLSPEELALAVDRLKRAHYRLMALKSAQARSGNRPTRDAA